MGAELREFAKGPKKRDISKRRQEQDAIKTSATAGLKSKPKDEQQSEKSSDSNKCTTVEKQREKCKKDIVPKQLTSHLLSLSSSNISEELKQSCSNIVASFKSNSSEKEFLLKRLQELIELEERQIRAEITKKNDVFVRQREKQNN